MYYGKDRTKCLKELNSYALVITTYSVVRLDWKRWLADPENPLTLHFVKWGRVVLDEGEWMNKAQYLCKSDADVSAHIIREPSKSFAKSTYALQADRRWAVTGTPIQNRLMDLFSLFKFLRCSPFDDLKVFNTQVTHKWKAKSDPESVAKLKILINCLSLRRPKTTIELLPGSDNIVYLDLNEQESEDYKRAKANTLYNIGNIEAGSREAGGGKFLNALKWVNELRLICNHGTRNPKETQKVEGPPPAWSAQEAQARFDQLEQVGLAKCSNSSCCQDLSSTFSGEGGAEHDDEPWIGQSLELWCCFCIESQTRRANKVHKICNHLPRRSQKLLTPDTTSNPSLETYPLALTSKATSENELRLPTKVKRLVQDLLETPEDLKRSNA